MSNVAETIGSRIRGIRGGLSQAEFASKLGVHKEMLGKYERDQSLPGADVLSRLRHAYGADINWLLTGEKASTAAENPPSPPAAPVEIDEELVRMVTESMMHIFLVEGVEVPTVDITVEMVRIYLDAMNYTDEEQRDAYAAGCAGTFVRGVAREIANMRRNAEKSAELEAEVRHVEEGVVERRHNPPERRTPKRAVR